jgi:SM-20-related protein
VSEARARTVTLVLQGGHTIRLAGAVDVASLIHHLHEPGREDDVVEILSGTTERVVLRRDALIGIMDSFGVSESAPPPAAETKYFVQIRNFLAVEDHKQIVMRALEREKDFQISAVTTGRQDYRNSVYLSEDDLIGLLFRQRLQNIAVEVAHSLGLTLEAVPDPEAIECQVTAHGDGGFYHVHNDSGSDHTASRVFSYVYYFQSRPHAFFGGELKLYDPVVENGIDLTGDIYHLIKPENNSIVFFASHMMHEVLPTYVPTSKFSDSRFTVNGWVRRTPITDNI